MTSLFCNQSIPLEKKSLCKIASVVYYEFTTNTDANRKRYLSGIFLPQVYHFKQWHGFTTGVIHSLKLVTRATPRNKTGNRANKWGYSVLAVEPLLHLYRMLFKSVLQVLFTKSIEGISMLYTFLFKGIARRDLSNTRKSIDEVAGVVYYEFTTTKRGNRSPYTSGIFLSEFYHFKQWHGFTTGVIHSLKLVTRAIRGNKALRTNNLSRLFAVVEPLLHLYRMLFKSVLQALLTKRKEGISMLYTFLFKGIARRDLSNTRKSIEELPTYTLRKQAESEQQARAFFAPFYVILEGGLVC